MDEYVNLCKDVGTIVEEIIPSFDSSTGYHEADHWEKHLSIDDMNHICEWSYLKDAFGTLTSFFKSSRNNLYSYIKPGIASTKFFQTFDINDEKHVLPEDIVRMQPFPPPMATNVVECSANLACDPIVTPTSTPVRKKNASIHVVSDELKKTVRTFIATDISVFSLYLQVDYYV